jgi:alpha/beta superfamily hydrolase
VVAAPSAVAIPVAGAHELEGEARLVPGAPGVVICHPHPAFGGDLDTPLVVALDGALAAAGFSTVRFNFRGVGASGGRATGGRDEPEDVRAACAWLRSSGAPRVALAGYSFGALMAMLALASGEPAAAVAAVGFPSTILGDDAARAADAARALGAGAPWLFVSGDQDPFSELERLRRWAADFPSVRVDVLAGAGHFFAGELERDVCRRVTEFLVRAIG